jgi:hypothetical protein
LIVGRDQEKSGLCVRFYDCTEENRSNNHSAIPITPQQFEDYAKFRIKFENNLVGKVIVGLNDQARKFMLGEIKNRTPCGHKHMIHWCDKKESIQKEEHLFGEFKSDIRHALNDFVLAIDNDQYLYKPAKIINLSKDRKTLTIEFLPPEKGHR